MTKLWLCKIANPEFLSVITVEKFKKNIAIKWQSQKYNLIK